jgi:hypothetical protein
MAARIETLETPVGSQSWLPPVGRFVSTAAALVSQWWKWRSPSLVMSDEWLYEFHRRGRS